jgi:hypothetical protein
MVGVSFASPVLRARAFAVVTFCPAADLDACQVVLLQEMGTHYIASRWGSEPAASRWQWRAADLVKTMLQCAAGLAGLQHSL